MCVCVFFICLIQEKKRKFANIQNPYCNCVHFIRLNFRLQHSWFFFFFIFWFLNYLLSFVKLLKMLFFLLNTGNSSSVSPHFSKVASKQYQLDKTMRNLFLSKSNGIGLGGVLFCFTKGHRKW